jgi:phage terminase large subunit GpA-like protein
MLDVAITDVDLADGAAIALEAWQRGCTPPPILTVSAYADARRKLPAEASAEPGQWRTSRTPYMRAVMDDLSVHSPVTEVALKKATQIAGTETAINFLAYVIDHAPGPMMYVLPTLTIAREFSDTRIQPMIDLMPTLRAKIGNKRSRDSGNTTLLKKFPAGFIVFAGANSANSLASRPVRYLVLDEVSKYPGDLDEQGAARVQAERRTSSFTTRKKIFRVSSPTIKDACAITAEYDRGDQRQYHVPCPHCRRLQILHIDQLTDDGDFLCLHCGKLIEERYKDWMLRERGHSDDGLAEWIAKYPDRTVRSYAIWSAYAPIGLGYTWKEIAAMRREANEDPDKKVTFVNTILGEAYEGASERVEATDVQQRAEKWLRRTIPRGCLLLLGAVDVQVNRFSIAIWGFGRGETAWLIDTVELPGDPTRKEDWHVVDDYFAQPITNACGIPMRAALVAVDSGNWTKEVYDYVRTRQQRGFYAIKGQRKEDHPLIARPRKEDTTRRGAADRHGVKRWNIGVTVAKNTLMHRLIRDGDLQDIERRRFHFPMDLEAEFYQQLTAERYDLTARRWLKPPGVRNEELDKLVYAYAMACSPMVRLNVLRDADWAALEAKLEPVMNDLFVSPQADAQAIPRGTNPSPTPPAAPGSRDGFASNDWSSRL